MSAPWNYPDKCDHCNEFLYEGDDSGCEHCEDAIICENCAGDHMAEYHGVE